jgi:hypothetical protein
VSHTGVWWKQVFDLLIETAHKLQALGFTYYNGKVIIIETDEEDTNV